MSIWVPAGARDVLTGESPIVGNVEEITATKNFLESVESNAEAYKWVLWNVGNKLTGMQSLSTAKVAAKLGERLVPGGQTLIENVGTAKDAFRSYEKSVDQIHSEARNLLRTVEDALGTIRAQSLVITDIATKIGIRVQLSWDSCVVTSMPEIPPSADGGINLGAQAFKLGYQWAWARAAKSWGQANQDIVRAKIGWRDLAANRRDAERRLVNSLNETYFGRLIAFGGGNGSMTMGAIAVAVSGEVRGVETSLGSVLAPQLGKLLTSGLDSYGVAAEWVNLDLSKEQVKGLPIAALAELASLNGVPAWAQDIASRRLLDYALKSPSGAYQLMGFDPEITSLESFIEQTIALDAGLADAELKALHPPFNLHGALAVQLVDFGIHDGAMTAAVSLGNIDTASNVAVNVPGMFSKAGDMPDGVDAIESLYKEAAKADSENTYAIVMWYGYHSPDLAEEAQMGRAKAGGDELAGFLTGIDALRGASGAPIEEFSLLGHSYGSTTAAEALKVIKKEHPELQLDSFVTYGSPGLEPGTAVKDLNVGTMYATRAAGDQTSWLGQVRNQRLDPTKIDGVIEFSSEGEREGDLRVTAHDMFTEDSKASFWNWGGKTGYLTPETGVVKDIGSVIADGSLRATPAKVGG